MPRVKHIRHYLAVITLSCLALFAGRIEACMVCIPFPEDTATDQLLAADVVVLARENPDKPFSFVAVEVLKGELNNPAIDRFVDSKTRRRLALRPEHSVVFTFDAATNHWRPAGYAAQSYQALVREILLQAPSWNQSGRAEKRARFFLPYLADVDPVIHELAYLEVGRASYDTIRRADSFVPTAQVHRFLANPQYLEWRALYILLLGVDAHPDEAKVIRAAMKSRARFDSTLNLSAWATALIEIDKTEAIEWLEKAYLGAHDRKSNAVLEIVKALSVHGALKQSRLRQRIADSYGVLVQTHPSLAGWAARDLTSWNDWRFADAFAELRKSSLKLDSATAYAIDYYIGRAQSLASN